MMALPNLLKEIKIEVTHKCPLACIHCSSDSSPSCNREMDLNSCLNIVQEANDMGVKKIVFSGGEPLIWEGLEKVVQKASQHTNKIIVYTSGNIKDSSTKLYTLKLCGVSKVVFSVFGANSYTHEGITRINGSFNATMKAVSAAVNLGYQTEFHFVPLKINYKNLSEIARLARQMGVSRISLLRFVPQGRGYILRKYALNRIQNIELKQMIVNLRKMGFDIRTGSPFNFLLINDQPSCMAAKDRLIVGPDLRIYPCDAFKQIKAEELVGTLHFSTLTRYSLKECWENSPFLKAVRDYLNKGFAEPCCHLAH
ncbi:Putative mycofactocin radical SAM maturase MftC [Neomoorella glycerini]|uniref:Mycofactocin radical SAM maturase MftC n=1 Tax=Neomoorella glycerini TaxID=55779 RepID=A0A6I5ZSM3_9FIRM|nr:radical SAM protein [Moorella glycerini]QGP92698.1 Putative mycofactocin radical SAM maturase MftC [Moorella glycerini]